jgi:glycosyl transferase family 25
MLSNNNNYFSTWVINVSSNKTKKKFIEKQLNDALLTYNIFEAITPKSISKFNHHYNARRTEIHYGRPLMETELACALSHISLWKKLLSQKKFSHFLILEDDVIINKKIKNLLRSFSFNDLDLVKFSGQHKRPSKLKNKLIQNRALYKLAYGPLDASAYMISKKAVLKILPYALNLNFAIDVIMDRSFEHKVPVYAIIPYPISSEWHNDPKDPLFTDIGLRTYKYSKSRNFFDRFKTKWIRLKTSYHRRVSKLKLILDL